MVILEPTQGIKQATGINFDVLGDIVSMILMNTHRKPIDFVCRIQKSRQPGVSQVIYADENKSGMKFDMKLDQSKHTRKFVFGSILHELRHCCQLNIWKYWPDTAKFNSFEEYYESKEERDARNMEKMTSIVIKMYDNAMKANEMYKTFGLTKLSK